MSDLAKLKSEYAKIHITEGFSHTLNYEKSEMIEGYVAMGELSLALAEGDFFPDLLDYEKELEKL